jgi:hypothetical protein
MSGLNNKNVLDAWEAHKNKKRTTFLENLRSEFPELAGMSDDRISGLAAKVVSNHQSKDGNFLQEFCENRLKIPFKRQVHINDSGIVVASGGTTIPDIVFGNPVVGTHISNYVVGSLKITSRERWKLDTAWVNKHPPKLFLYISLAADYPSPKTFHEGPTRKLVCATPKKKDDRVFKLGFEDIEATVLAAL